MHHLKQKISIEHNFGLSDFNSMLKVGSVGTHSGLPPCAPTSSSSQTPGTIGGTKAVGKGPRLVPVSYANPQDLTITHFLPVCVCTAKEETCVKALVAEKNAEFNRKHSIRLTKQLICSIVYSNSILIYSYVF